MNKQKLDLGCGKKKRPGTIGADISPYSDADVICDLNKLPYPFQESVFDEVYLDNVIEHLNDVVKVLEEVYRISKNNALIKIDVPYFRSQWAFIDPTHKHFFTLDSFSYFDNTHIHNKLYRYSTVSFCTEKVVFNEKIIRTGIMGLFKLCLKKFANKFPGRYERYLSNFFPLDELTFYLRVKNKLDANV